MTTKRTYLDYNATAPLRREAREAMLAALDQFGNPSSVHTEGRQARRIVDEARDAVATLVGAKPAEVVFTSGASEANAWALSGLLSGTWKALVTGATEHQSVAAPAAQAAMLMTTEVLTVPVTTEGVAKWDGTPLAARPGTLVALQLANNETGVLQPVAALAALGREHGFEVHTDAVQAAGRIEIDFRAIGAVTLSLSAHKMGGPKGIGALIIREGVRLPPLIAGGGQEGRRRGGTENVAAIAGFGAAARAAYAELGESQRLARLRDALEAEVIRMTPDAVIVGHGAPRLHNTSCIALPGRSAETLVIKLDLAGIAVSAGAACSSGKVGQSAVLAAMGLPQEIQRGAIRVSFGFGSSEKDVAAFLAAWKEIAGGRQLAA